MSNTSWCGVTSSINMGSDLSPLSFAMRPWRLFPTHVYWAQALQQGAGSTVFQGAGETRILRIWDLGFEICPLTKTQRTRSFLEHCSGVSREGAKTRRLEGESPASRLPL